jgi:hypothetical protein
MGKLMRAYIQLYNSLIKGKGMRYPYSLDAADITGR